VFYGGLRALEDRPYPALPSNERGGTTNVESDSPLLIIWQQSDFPGPRGSTYPDGLIAAVWSDGLVIRATDKNNIGKAYIEGHARPKEFSEFLRFITSPTLLSTPDEFAVAVDSASRSIALHHAGKKHNWTRTIPDEHRTLNEIEAQSWALPLEKARSLDPKNTDLRRFRR
jgi:hypothetical protein